MLDILKDVTVIDLTSNVAGPFCTLILKDLGATIWKIESPDGGDVVRRWPPFAADGVSTTFVALNRGKQSVALDLKKQPDLAALFRMVERAEVLVSSMRPGSLHRLGIDAQKVAAINPRLIYADISAFGGMGARGGQPGFDAVLQAYTGLMDLTGYPDRPPARVGTGLLDLGTGMWTALGVLSAMLRRDREGAGVEVSATLFGTAVGFLMYHLASVELAGLVPHRIGTAQHNSAPYEAFSTSDGMVMVGVTSPSLWRRFCQAIGDPDLATHADYLTNDLRVEHRLALHELVQSRTRLLSRSDLVRSLEEAGVPCSPIRTVGELVSDPQLEAAGIWQQTAHGGRAAAIPLRIGSDLPEIGSTAATLGADTRTVLSAVGVPADDIAILTGPAGARRPTPLPHEPGSEF
jgi:crotonobetainyl-CoA:carnitine CoA-transferase CaiB-like acyl-CoA transferase